MRVRNPVVAGQFYPADREEARRAVIECLAVSVDEEAPAASLVAGLVPHAGWVFSGPLAAMVFAAVQQRCADVKTFVVCGAAHGYLGQQPAVDDSDHWETPLGSIEIDRTLRTQLVDRGAAVVDGAAHRGEHSIEVQVPFIQHLFPGAQLLPIIVPARETALALGEVLGTLVTEAAGAAVCIGSTDLTHYGPRYGFSPAGVGAEGVRWAHTVNDRAFIDRALRLEAEALLREALECGSACGPGAAAATIAAARRQGIESGCLLAQTNSSDIMSRQMGTASRDSVGYAAIVF